MQLPSFIQRVSALKEVAVKAKCSVFKWELWPALTGSRSVAAGAWIYFLFNINGRYSPLKLPTTNKTVMPCMKKSWPNYVKNLPTAVVYRPPTQDVHIWYLWACHSNDVVYLLYTSYRHAEVMWMTLVIFCLPWLCLLRWELTWCQKIQQSFPYCCKHVFPFYVLLWWHLIYF